MLPERPRGALHEHKKRRAIEAGRRSDERSRARVLESAKNIDPSGVDTEGGLRLGCGLPDIVRVSAYASMSAVQTLNMLL